MDAIGAEYAADGTGLFLWGRIPESSRILDLSVGAASGLDDSSASVGGCVSDFLLERAGVFVTPGFIFGRNGRDYVRISLCAKPEILEESARKISELISETGSGSRTANS